VPITPDAVLNNMVGEFKSLLHGRSVGARFTLPFGIVAAASLSSFRLLANRWAGLDLIRPKSATMTGGYQISVTAHARQVGPTVQSPFLFGAAWQTRASSREPFDVTRYKALTGNDQSRYAIMTSYHTSYIMGFLCATALGPSCAPLLRCHSCPAGTVLSVAIACDL
jgi:hypothetical protein